MSVADAGGGTSTVKLVTDFTVAGRIANFGRGVMEDVSKRLVSQMADCIKANLESAAEPASRPAPAANGATGPAPVPPTSPSAAPAPAPAATPTAPPARPVNALGLFFSVLWGRIRRLFGGR
jgi:hypothetical protein